MKLRSPCHTLPPYGAQQCGREVTPAEISQGKTLPANVAKVSGRGGASDVIRNLPLSAGANASATNGRTEKRLAAEVLEVGALHPAIAQSFVGKVVGVLEH